MAQSLLKRTPLFAAHEKLGARLIEKHFTLDEKSSGPDHAMSLNPEELGTFVKEIRLVEAALGDGIDHWAFGETCAAAVHGLIVHHA